MQLQPQLPTAFHPCSGHGVSGGTADTPEPDAHGGPSPGTCTTGQTPAPPVRFAWGCRPSCPSAAPGKRPSPQPGARSPRSRQVRAVVQSPAGPRPGGSWAARRVGPRAGPGTPGGGGLLVAGLPLASPLGPTGWDLRPCCGDRGAVSVGLSFPNTQWPRLRAFAGGRRSRGPKRLHRSHAHPGAAPPLPPPGGCPPSLSVPAANWG